MDSSEIEILLQKDFTQINRVLSDFLHRTATVFTFPSFSKDNRMLVWTALMQHLQNPQSSEIHQLCLATIKILSRDKVDLEKLLCEEWINILIERAGLHHLAAYDEESLPTTCFPHKDIIIEALKCLYNITLNSEAARSLCARSCLAEGLVCRLRVYHDLPSRNDIMLFDLRILVILTTHREDFRDKIKELHGIEYLINCLKEILSEAAKSLGDRSPHVLNDDEVTIVCEILKTQFNLMLGKSPVAAGASETDDVVYLQMVPLLHTLLIAKTNTPDKQIELRTQVANFLTSVPATYYHHLTPALSGELDKPLVSYEGHNMEAMQALLELLQHCLESAKELKTQFESLSVILTVMYKASGACRVQRKFLRAAILPPLTDVSKPPEQGETLRNHLCRLLTSPVTQIRDLAAGFLFILCKENVSRMVKYTGFGNAAGLLAQRGLLCGGKGDGYSSSSDDSDTDEYLAAQPTLDPVVGCTRPPRLNPFEGMSEEQKEYSAMELVNILSRLSSSGLIQPARVGEDGRPQPVEHILQLRDDINSTNRQP